MCNGLNGNISWVSRHTIKVLDSKITSFKDNEIWHQRTSGFFEKQGFELANVMDFPEKVWNECVRCPFFSNCREIAVVRELHND